jgi:RNA polymerase sigma factor (sigma-70 family)
MTSKSQLEVKNKASLEEASDEIVLAAAEEYPDLFAVLMERYQKPFLRLAGRILNSKEEAEDVVQEAFLKIYRFSGQLREGADSKFKSWAYKIVFNTALTHYRKLKKRFGEEEYLDTFLYDVFKGKDVESEINASILVKEVLEKMPAELREVLELHYLKELPYAEIAEKKNITVPALKMKLYRARELFRKHLDGKDATVINI